MFNVAHAYLRGGPAHMNGNARTIERRIRLWIVQEERNRRREGQLVRMHARGDTPTEPRQRAVSLRKRPQWQ
jgi:SLT domain-containing protein